jgi:hypothetical protein
LSIPEPLVLEDRLRLLLVSDELAEPVELLSFDGVTPVPIDEPDELEPDPPVPNASLLELVPVTRSESEVDPLELMPPEPPPGRRSLLLPLVPDPLELPVPDPELPDVLLPLRS